MPSKPKSKLNDKFYFLLENLFRELDQNALKLEVEALKKRKPQATKSELVSLLTRRAALKAGFTGMGAGAPGGFLGLLAIGPDIYNLVRQQSRLILSIAFVYEQEPHLEERIREVLATLAIATGATASQRGVRYLISKGMTTSSFKALLRKVAGKYAARKLPAAIGPIVGGAAGAAINYAAVKSISSLAEDYYRELNQAALTATPPALEGSAELPDSRIVETTGSSKKSRATSGKTAAKKSSPSSKKKKSSSSSRKTTTKKSSSKKSAPRKSSSGESAAGKKDSPAKKKRTSSKSSPRKSSSKKKSGSAKKKKTPTKKKTSKKSSKASQSIPGGAGSSSKTSGSSSSTTTESSES